MMDDDERRILDQLRHDECRVGYTYLGVLLCALVLMIIVAVLVFG